MRGLYNNRRQAIGRAFVGCEARQRGRKVLAFSRYSVPVIGCVGTPATVGSMACGLLFSSEGTGLGKARAMIISFLSRGNSEIAEKTWDAGGQASWARDALSMGH
jgi:hypothetical protein